MQTDIISRSGSRQDFRPDSIIPRSGSRQDFRHVCGYELIPAHEPDRCGFARKTFWSGFFLLVIGLFLLTPAGQGQQPPGAAGSGAQPVGGVASPSNDTATWQQFVNATTILLIKVDTAALDDELWMKLEQSLTPETRHQFSKWTQVHRQTLQSLREAVGGESIYLAVDVPYTHVQSPLRLYLPKGDADLEKLLAPFRGLTGEHAQVQGDYLLITPGYQTKMDDNLIAALGFRGSAPQGKPYTELLPVARRAELEDALTVLHDESVQILILPPEYLRSTFRDLLPNLPPEIGGGPTRTLVDGARWTSIGIDLEDAAVNVTIESESPSAAAAFADQLPKMVQHIASTVIDRNVQPKQHAVELSGLFAQLLQPKVEGDRVIISIDTSGLEVAFGTASKLLENLLGPVLQQATMDKFKRIGLAMHNHESAYRSLPPAREHRDTSGKSQLSWRVYLLPFLGENDLYRQFHLDEPWDSEHNVKLLDRMPDAFRPTNALLDAELQPGYSVYVAPVGEGTIFGGEKPVGLGDITDGTSNTVWLVEVKPEFAVPWTAPQDYQFSPQNPAAGLAIGSDGHFVAGVADGSIHRLPGDMPAENLLHLFQMNDGHPVKW